MQMLGASWCRLQALTPDHAQCMQELVTDHHTQPVLHIPVMPQVVHCAYCTPPLGSDVPKFTTMREAGIMQVGLALVLHLAG